MGSRMPTTLSTTVLPAVPIHTARHTKMLHRMPRKKIVTQSIVTLPAATLTMELATASPLSL